MSLTRSLEAARYGWLLGLAMFAAGSAAVRSQSPSATDPAETEKFESALAEGQRLLDLGCYHYSENCFQEAIEHRRDSQPALAGLEKVKRKLADEGEPIPARASTQKFVRKLGKITLPRLHLDNVRLMDALEFLRCKSIQLDIDPDSDHQGVEFILQLPELVSSTRVDSGQIPGPTPNASLPPATSNSTVTLSLYQIPVFEAASYIASRVGLKAKLHDGKIYLVGQNYLFPEEIITRKFRLSPVMSSRWMARWGFSERAYLPDVMTELWTSEGIIFPDGTSADYSPAKEELIVHQTFNNILLLEAILGSMK